MTLLIDLGNTRVKWAALRSDGTLGAQRAASHAGWKSGDFAHALEKSLKPGSDVWVVSVAAKPIQARLKSALRSLSAGPVHFIETSAECAGVRNGYHEPWRLGVDRWVALIGARARAPTRMALIADVGTAITLDILRQDGQHLGGVIVPGTDLMQQSLLSSTGGIRARAGVRRKTPRQVVFWQAHSTAQAVQYGSLLAAAAVIDAAYDDYRRLRPRLFVTGGGANLLQGLIKSPCECIPGLVLEGLARAVQESD